MHLGGVKVDEDRGRLAGAGCQHLGDRGANRQPDVVDPADEFGSRDETRRGGEQRTATTQEGLVAEHRAVAGVNDGLEMNLQ